MSKQSPSQTPQEEALAVLRANAEFVVNALTPGAKFPMAFDGRSVEWLDGYIERIRTKDWEEEELDRLVSNLGSFLGEALLAQSGGGWVQAEEGWLVQSAAGVRANPFTLVDKQFRHGASESVYAFFRAQVVAPSEG